MKEAKLKRTLGLPETIALGTGTMLGAGIFTLAAIAASHAGTSTSISFVLGGIIALLTALSYAELSTMFAESGGPYIYVRKAMGNFLGFGAGWFLWFGYMFACAAYAIGFSNYLLQLVTLPDILAIAGIVSLVGLLNIIGGKSSAKAQIIITIFISLVLTFFIFFGLSQMRIENWKPFAPKGIEGIVEMTGLLFITFLGFELVSSAASEVKNPDETIPKAIFLSIALVTILYISYTLILTGLIPYTELHSTSIVLASEKSMGYVGKMVIIFAALFATISSLNGSILAASRISYSMGKKRDLWGPFSRINRKFHSPVISIISVCFLIILISFAGIISLIAYTTTLLFLLVFILVNVAVLVLRYTHQEMKRPFRTPLVPYLPVGALFSCVLLLLGVDFRAWLFAGGIMVIGLIIYSKKNFDFELLKF